MTHACPTTDEFGFAANKAWNDAQTETPNVLYHYTGAGSFLSIGQSRSMWASAFECMNDPGEFRLGLGLAKAAIRASIARLGITKADELQNNWDKFFEDEVQNPLMRPYVVSLSDTPNNDHMWENYADKMQGVALKFDFSKDAAAKSLSFIVRMQYDQATALVSLQKQLGILEGILPQVSCDMCLAANIRNLLASYLQVAFLFGISLKDPHWSPEGEWRLVTFAASDRVPQSPFFGDIKYRSRGSELVDYLDVGLCKAGLDLKGVVRGKAFKHEQSLGLMATRANIAVLP